MCLSKPPVGLLSSSTAAVPPRYERTTPPDCSAHDAIYRRLRTSGAAGWGNDQEINDRLGRVQPWLATVPPPVTLLELRCDAGNLSLVLAARGDRVTGVDIAPTAAHWAHCLEAVHRVLRPGDAFIVATMCGEVLDERRLSQFDAQTSTVVSVGRPSRTIGQADDIVVEVARAGFDILSVHVQPRRQPSEQDDLFVLARKHPGLPAD